MSSKYWETYKNTYIEEPYKKISDCKIEEILNLTQNDPEINLLDLSDCLSFYRRKKILQQWQKDITEYRQKTIDQNTIEHIVFHWNRVIDEFRVYSILRLTGLMDSFCKDDVLAFDLVKIYNKQKENDNNRNELAYRLIEVKLYYCFIVCLKFYLVPGPFRIVGKSEIWKMSPDALLALYSISIKISHLSILIEKTLDLIEIIAFQKCTDIKHDKWRKKIEAVKEFFIFSDEEIKTINEIKDIYRNAELHKMSSIRSMTSKQKWNWLSEHEDVICRIIQRIVKLETKE